MSENHSSRPRVSEPPSEELRTAWKKANVRPLWESGVAHRNRTERDRAYVWPWRDLAPLIDAASILESMSAIERRILSLVSPHITTVKGFGTATNISTGLQILMPGEAARAHRHSMNAFRFVLQGEGATTIVDGKHCEMAYGDLISTPAWSWHEHVNKGSQRVVWLDVLDASLHRYLGTDVFEAGPAPAPPSTTPDSAYAVPGLVPEGAPHSAEYSPFYRYAWSEVVVALRAAPLGKDGARRVRYVNPHGGPVMSLLDCWAMELAPGAETLPFRTSANLVCVAVEGDGETRTNEDVLAWSQRDIVSLPNGNWIRHRAGDNGARLFFASDRDVLRRLGVLREEWGAPA